MSRPYGNWRSRDGKAVVMRSEIHSEDNGRGWRHTLSFEIDTITREQAEQLQLAFLEWLETLEFQR